MTSYHLIPTWHEWNANANDVMIMWFTIYQTLVMSCQACAACADVHGIHEICKTSVSKYLSGQECMPADLNLVKMTASHFWVLNTQNANQNMPDMIPIAHLNENFTNCDENLEWGNSEPLVCSYMFW